MRTYKNYFLAFFILAILTSCNKENKDTSEKYNILWLSCEDISPLLSFYGDSTAKTPVLDKLASESMVFTNAFATVGVCAPARSSIITGMYPVSIGTMHMRTGKDVFAWGKRVYKEKTDNIDVNGESLREYSAVISPKVKCFTEYLREEGYYCTNNAKTDYQFAAPVTAWDENGESAHWKNAPIEKPFFSVFNFGITHESRIWRNKDIELTVSPDSVPLPPYFPNTETIRNDVARCYSNIELLDKLIGEKIKEIETAGLLDKTIIFFFSDHGGPLPRGKREHYDSGLRVPLLVRFPNGENAGKIYDMVSFVDFAPTILSLAGINSKDYMQGQAFLGEYKRETKRKYIYGSGDRFDEFSDMIRCMRDEQFLYVKNFHPELPKYKDVGYRKNMDMMNEMLRLKEESKLDSVQQIWFSESKTSEELYDCINDPFQVNNIANKPEYAEILSKYRKELQKWQEEVGDLGFIPEKQLINQMWPNGIQPKTINPEIVVNNGNVSLRCETEGASIAYLISEKETNPGLDSGWILYSKPFQLKEGENLFVLANRIGFADSDIIHQKMP
jgi:arylsulfatase A-like enzyme